MVYHHSLLRKVITVDQKYLDPVIVLFVRAKFEFEILCAFYGQVSSFNACLLCAMSCCVWS